MNFESLTPIDIKNLTSLAIILFLFFVIMVFYFILSRKRKEFKNEKSKILRETRVPLNKAIKLATYNFANSFKMEDPIFEFKRGKLFSDLKKDMSKMFKEDTEEIFSKLYDIRNLYCEHEEMPTDLFQREFERINSFYYDANFLIEVIKSSKKIGELFVEYPKAREQLLLKIAEFNEEKIEKDE